MYTAIQLKQLWLWAAYSEGLKIRNFFSFIIADHNLPIPWIPQPQINLEKF